MKVTFLCTLACALLLPGKAFSQCSATGNSVVTSYASNNGSRGAMFDITATNLVTITCFDANLYNGTANYEIWYKQGSYIGSEENQAAWTLIGSASVSSLGPGNATPLPINVNVAIPAGQTCAFYVTNTVNGGVNYTTSASQGVTLGSDANIAVTGGVGKAYPFSTTYSYRLFNGTVHYVPGTPLPVEMSGFYASPNGQRVRLNWRTETELNNQYFTIERSADAADWKVVGAIDGAVNSQQPVTYEMFDDQPLPDVSYYRISQTDTDGKQRTYAGIRTVNRTPLPQQALLVYPNPAGETATLAGSADELEHVKIVDLLGKDLTDRVHFKQAPNGLVLDLSRLNAGILIIRSDNGFALLRKN